MDLSLMSPLVPARPEDLSEVATLVRDHGALTRLWQGQGYGVDPCATFAHLAGTGVRVPAGLAVLLTTLRHPWQAALEARTLGLVTGYPPLVGLGPGSRILQQAATGAAYAHPVEKVADFVLAMRRSLSQLVASDVRHPRYAALPSGDEHAVLPYVSAPLVRIGLGVLRRGMARLAGELADAAITWLAPPAYLRNEIVPTVERAAEESSRKRPRMVAMVPVALHRRHRDPLVLAHLSAAGHLAQPHYAAMAAAAGIRTTDESVAMRQLIAADGFVYGSAEEVAARMQRYRDAGVDELVLHLGATRALAGQEAALRDLHELLPALTRTCRPATEPVPAMSREDLR